MSYIINIINVIVLFYTLRSYINIYTIIYNQNIYISYTHKKCFYAIMLLIIQHV